jgi:hypothetical protein
MAMNGSESLILRVKHTFVELVTETTVDLQLRKRFSTDSAVNHLMKREDSFASTDCDSNEDSTSEAESPASWADVVDDDEDDDCRTTVMLRGLAETMDRDSLMTILGRTQFRSCFDFVYLPGDFNTLRPQGFAFVNFLDHHTALRFQQDLPRELGSDVQVLWSDKEQGIDENVARYRNSPVMHNSLPEQFRPVLLRNGAVVSFPKPTKAIKAPKIKRSAM